MWCPTGISAGSGADTAVGADKDAVLHGHSACDEDDCEGRGCQGAVPGLGGHAAASDPQPGHQLHSLRHPALPLAPVAW